jgi:uncharacterized protein YeaO (DUF488 family)
MISTSDGLSPEEEAKNFARDYAKELQEEKEQEIQEIVDRRMYTPGDEPLYGMRGQDLNSKLESGQIKIL